LQKSDHPSALIITLVVIFGILSVSTSSIFIRFAQADSVNSMVIASARLTVASLILAPLALTRYWQELRQVSKKDLALGAFSGFFLALHFMSWITSLEFTTIISSVVLVTTTPLWVAILAPFLLKEKVNSGLVLGMALALVGGLLIALSDSCTWTGGFSCAPFSDILNGNSFIGNLLATLGAWMAAGYILIGRQLRSKLSLIPYIFIVYGFAAVFSMAFVIGMAYQITGFAPKTYLWLMLLGLVPQLFGHSSFNWALKYLNATMVSVLLFGEPIGSTILGILVYNEIPPLLSILGGVLILIGIFITTTSSGKK